mmetsp:Transcript_2202/g.5153  ORF Transcript_2202/g.5153 Transcript_2202/m.5153 type:complete len:233 (-) Transcript_2202:126-824(-)
MPLVLEIDRRSPSIFEEVLQDEGPRTQSVHFHPFDKPGCLFAGKSRVAQVVAAQALGVFCRGVRVGCRPLAGRRRRLLGLGIELEFQHAVVAHANITQHGVRGMRQQLTSVPGDVLAMHRKLVIRFSANHLLKARRGAIRRDFQGHVVIVPADGDRPRPAVTRQVVVLVPLRVILGLGRRRRVRVAVHGLGVRLGGRRWRDLGHGLGLDLGARLGGVGVWLDERMGRWGGRR